MMRDRLSFIWGPNGASLRRVMSGPVIASTPYTTEVPISLNAATASSSDAKRVGNCKDTGDVAMEALDLFVMG